MNQERESLSSRLGFILISAGCAIGVGNVWKFPTITGQNGGGFFVLFYLLFLLIMGIPVMTMEFSMGRAAKKSPVLLYPTLLPEKKGGAFRPHGLVCLLGNVILMMFYTSVTAWMLRYVLYMLSGKFNGMDQAAAEGVFGEMLGDPVTMVLLVALVVALGFFVCSFDMQKGLEKVSKYMMLALLGIMVLLAVNAFTMGGAKEGLSFYLMPNLDRLLDPAHNGILGVIVAAMNQAFFTLSIGMGSMAIFGSFIDRDRALLGESVRIAALDTFVAFAAGLIIFPACFTYGIEPTAGPSLIFQTLPFVFQNMWLGNVWGTLFFVFLSFAALSTVFAVFQNILSCTQELFGWNKKKACLIDGIALFLLALPCVLGFLLPDGAISLGKLTSVLDVEDYLVSNIILPAGSLIFVIFCTQKAGWGFDRFMAEANTGKGLKIKRWMYGYMKYALPILIGAILVISVISPFVDLEKLLFNLFR